MKVSGSFYKKLRKNNIKYSTGVKGSELTSIGIGGTIDCIIYPTTLEKLKTSVILLREYNYPYYKLGNGTNVIISDKPSKKVAICMSELKKILEILGNRLLVDAGYRISFVASKMNSLGNTGWEYATGIPGFIGGAIKGNAGAFNNSTLKNLMYIWCIDKYGDLMEIGKEKIDFSYRYTNIPERYIIYRALFRLNKGQKSKIKRRVEKFKSFRKAMHPSGEKSAGSVFKNPGKRHAGRLIEQCNLKGKKVGALKVSEKHANYIINTGKGKFSDFQKLARFIQTKVKSKVNVNLKLEVKILR